MSLADEAIHAYKRGDFSGAAKPAERALNLARSAFGLSDPATLSSMHFMALVFDRQGRYSEAEPLFRESLNVRRQTFGPKGPETLDEMNNLAMVLMRGGKYSEAEPLFRETLALRREAEGPRHIDTLASMNNLAVLLSNQGRYLEAEQLHRETLELRQQILGPEHAQTIISMNNLATVLLEQGRFGEAEVLYRDALPLVQKRLGRKNPSIIVNLGNLASVLEFQRRYDEAEPLFREALSLSEEVLGPKNPDTLISLNNLAGFLESQGRYSEAEPLFRRALDLKQEVLGPKHRGTFTSMNNLAAVLADQGQNSEAEQLHRKTLDLRQQVLGPKHPDTLSSMYDLAFLLRTEGQYVESERLFRETLERRKEVLGSSHPETLETWLNLTFDLAVQGHVVDAITLHWLMEPLILDRLGAELYTTESAKVRRQTVASQNIYQDIAVSLAQSPEAGVAGGQMAASALLRFKGLAVEEDAYLARLSRSGNDEHIRAVAAELRDLHAQMARLTQGNFDPKVQGILDSQQMTDLIARVDAKQLELGRLSHNYATSLQVRNASLQDLQARLPERSALLDIRLYHRVDFKTATFGPARFAGVLIPPTGDIVVRDLGATDETDASVNFFLSGSPEATEKAATALYQQLLAPFAADLADLKHLYVAPDGSLNLVSFGLLRAPDGARVMDRFDLRLVQTGRDLLRPAADKPAKGLIAVGGIDFDLALPAIKADATPAIQMAQADAIVDRVKRTRGDTLDSLRNGFGALAHSKEEVETIADLYGDARRDETVVLADGSAKAPTPTKDWLLRLPPARVLHLATHGFYRAPKQPSDQPMLLAGIALAGANRSLKEGGDGGILYALEAQDLNLEGTELVVLSACQTALGQYDYGDGVSGLVRALRVAGARNVLVTLRSVDDEQAARFMQRFYFHWLSQKQSDPAAALRDAQAEYTNAPNQDTTWTSFIIVGE